MLSYISSLILIYLSIFWYKVNVIFYRYVHVSKNISIDDSCNWLIINIKEKMRIYIFLKLNELQCSHCKTKQLGITNYDLTCLMDKAFDYQDGGLCNKWMLPRGCGLGPNFFPAQIIWDHVNKVSKSTASQLRPFWRTC